MFYEGDGGKKCKTFSERLERIMKQFRNDQVKGRIGKIFKSVLGKGCFNWSDRDKNLFE